MNIGSWSRKTYEFLSYIATKSTKIYCRRISHLFVREIKPQMGLFTFISSFNLFFCSRVINLVKFIFFNTDDTTGVTARDIPFCLCAYLRRTLVYSQVILSPQGQNLFNGFTRSHDKIMIMCIVEVVDWPRLFGRQLYHSAGNATPWIPRTLILMSI